MTAVAEGRRADVDELDAVAELLGAAFVDDPWTRWCVDADNHRSRITALQRLALDMIGFPCGSVWVTEQDGQLLSAAVWTDSTVAPEPEVVAAMAEQSRPFHGDRLAAAVSAETGSHPRPATPHLFLETIGTRPEFRRRGYATAALTPGLTSADRRGLICALETSTMANVAFYRGVGFDVVDHRVVDGGGPDVWAMQRPPRARH